MSLRCDYYVPHGCATAVRLINRIAGCSTGLPTGRMFGAARIYIAASLQGANPQGDCNSRHIRETGKLTTRSSVSCLFACASNLTCKLLALVLSDSRTENRRHFHAKSIATGSARHQVNTSASLLG